MRKDRVLFLMIGILMSACGSSRGIEVEEAWVRSGLQDGNTAAYMTIVNESGQADALLGVSSDIARFAELHLSQAGSDGVMQMIPQESIDLPTGGRLELKPGSYHKMLTGLNQDLVPGDTITIMLDFENHEDISVTIPVKDSAEMGGAGMDGHMP
ncbi:MAG: copper chaperone PCu(A)C [Chloroflexi bacterium]|nr:copper chaperone PCu(A)C [Chloroflexota bacterium]